MLVNDRSIRRHVDLTYAVYSSDTLDGPDARACALINGIYDADRAQRKLRRALKDPSLVVLMIEHDSDDYVMSLEKFISNAIRAKE